MSACSAYTQKSSGPHVFEIQHQQKCEELLLSMSNWNGSDTTVSDIHKVDDIDLIYRFLIAVRFDVDKAKVMLGDYVKWRREQRVNNVLWYDFPPTVMNFAFCGFHGVDKEGYPVYYERPDPQGITAVLKESDRDSVLRWHFAMMELSRRKQLEARKDRVTCVMDLSQLGLGILTNSTARGFLKEAAHYDQALYPENMRYMILINVPWAFNAVWKMVRPLLDERVQKKISLYYGEASTDGLRKVIDDKNIPTEFGGGGGPLRMMAHEILDIRANSPPGTPPAVPLSKTPLPPTSPAPSVDSQSSVATLPARATNPSAKTSADNNSGIGIVGSRQVDGPSRQSSRSGASPSVGRNDVPQDSPSTPPAEVENGSFHSAVSSDFDSETEVSPRSPRNRSTSSSKAAAAAVTVYSGDGSAPSTSSTHSPRESTVGGNRKPPPTRPPPPPARGDKDDLSSLRSSFDGRDQQSSLGCLPRQNTIPMSPSASVLLVLEKQRTVQGFESYTLFTSVGEEIAAARHNRIVKPREVHAGELVDEGGHPMHTFVQVVDDQSFVQFVLKVRIVHDEIIIYRPKRQQDGSLPRCVKIDKGMKAKQVETDSFMTCRPSKTSKNKSDWRILQKPNRVVVAERKGNEVRISGVMNEMDRSTASLLLLAIAQLWQL